MQAYLFETLVAGLHVNDTNKAHLKLGPVFACFLALIIPVFSLLGYAAPAVAVEESTCYQVELTITTSALPATTSTLLSYIEITPHSGPAGTIVTVSLTDFSQVVEARVWFDSNGNGAYDVDEPFLLFTTFFNQAISSNYTGSVQLIVPDVPDGDYQIYVDIPVGSAVEFAVNFQITSPFLMTWYWVIGGVVAAAAISAIGIRNQSIKRRAEKTDEKFDKGEISLKVSKTAGKTGISPDTPFKAEKAFTIRVTRGAVKQSVEVKGSLLRDAGEEK
jgi:hypothetical protein